MQPKQLKFMPIDFDEHASLCVAFRRDSFICSFGVDNFFDDAGPDGVHYIERLRLRATKFRDGYVHVWHDDRIVGQMEMQILEEPRAGYVNLFYLVEGMRGSGRMPGPRAFYAVAFAFFHSALWARLAAW